MSILNTLYSYLPSITLFRNSTDNLKNVLIKHNLQYGPINKSIHTQQMEYLVKCMLKAPRAVEMSGQIGKNGKYEYHAKCGNIDINVTQLLKKIDYSHLSFSKEDSDFFVKEVYPYYVQWGNWDPNRQESSLTLGEEISIKDYTGSDYLNINHFMYGKEIYSDIKNTFLKCVMIASGLNKITPDCPTHSETYRGDKPSKEEIQKRIDLIKEGGGITESDAYFSTSLNKEVAEGFGHNVVIQFEDRYGKSIKSVSIFEFEQEYLLEPATILWTKYEYKDHNHIFHAQVIEPLDPKKESVTQEEIAKFKALMEWGQKLGITPEGMTDYAKDLLGITQNEDLLNGVTHKMETLKLEDCLSLQDDYVIPHSNPYISMAPVSITNILPIIHQEQSMEIL